MASSPAWGENGLRVQANLAGKLLDLPQALLELPSDDEPEVFIEIEEGRASIRNGMIEAIVSYNGKLTFLNALTGQTLLEEPEEIKFAHAPPNRHFKYRNGGLHKLEAWFKAQEGERFFGLRQHQHGRLDQRDA